MKRARRPGQVDELGQYGKQHHEAIEQISRGLHDLHAGLKSLHDQGLIWDAVEVQVAGIVASLASEERHAAKLAKLRAPDTFCESENDDD